MGSHQVLPPGNAATTTTKVNGRTYTCALGSVLTVPDFDADVLEANGWIKGSVSGSGASTSRPAVPLKGAEFHDLTLGYNIKWDGKVWRNPTSGAAV